MATDPTIRIPLDPRCRHDAPHGPDGCTLTWQKDGQLVRCGCLLTQAEHDTPGPLRVLDLFAGLGGWSAAFRDAGDQIVTLDLDPAFHPTYAIDASRSLVPYGLSADIRAQVIEREAHR